MFVSQDDVVEIKIYYIKRGRFYEAFTRGEYEEEKASLKKQRKKFDEGEYSLLKVKMLELTWGLYNELHESALVTDSKGEKNFNYKAFKEGKLLRLIKEWDAKDPKTGYQAVCDEVNIKSLSPNIAEAILRGYDEENMMSEETEKN